MLNYALLFLLILYTVPNNKNIQDNFDQLIKESGSYYMNHDFENAILIADNAYTLALSNGYKWGKIKAQFVLAFLHEKNDEYEKALPYYLDLIDRYDDFDSNTAHKDHCKLFLNLGNIMMSNSKYNDAIEFYNKGISVAELNKQESLVYDLLNNKIIALRKAKKYNQAITTYKVKNNLLSPDEKEEILRNNNQLGNIYIDQGKLNQARKQFEKTLTLESSKPTALFSGKAYINTANTFFIEENLTQAEYLYNKALTLVEEANAFEDKFLIHQSLTKLFIKSDNPYIAMQHAYIAQENFIYSKKTIEDIEIFSLISDIHFNLNQIEKGKEYAKEHARQLSMLIERQQKLTEIGNQFKIDYITTSYYAEKDKKRNTNTFIWVIISMIVSFLIFRLYQLYRKIQVAKLLRAEMELVNFDLDN